MARKVELKLVAFDEQGRVDRPTPSERVSAGTRVAWEGFHELDEAAQMTVATALVKFLQENPKLAKALGLAVSAHAAAEPAPSWAPVEYQVAIMDDKGNPIGRLIRRGNTAKDVGMKGFTNDRDYTLWNFDPEKS